MTAGDNPGIFQIGDVLNNTYRIDKVLGLGGTSEVYRAVSEISGRVVAVKALRAEFSRNEDFLALMTREEAMREIRHDAIVRYYDNQRTDDGHVYLVMDYVDGPGLDQKIKDGGMSAEDVITICRRVAEGLRAAHAKNIVHRDLSPDNIILRNGDPNDAVIIDFGIAKDTNPGAETIVGNEFAGKYAYAAPEQLSGQTDERADIYALGALLLSTFRGKRPNIGSNLMNVVNIKSLPLDTEGVPEPLKTLIDRMTRPDRDHRLQAAQEVLDEIDGRNPAPEATDDDRTVVMPRSKRDEPALSEVATIVEPQSPAPTPTPAPPDDPEPRKSRGPMMLVLAVLVVTATGLVAYFSGAIDGLLGPRYPVVEPYTLLVSRDENEQPVAQGHVPSESVHDTLGALITETGGTPDLTLASGAIPDSWGPDVLRLIEAVRHLPEWEVRADETTARITGLTYDRAERDRLISAFDLPDMRGAFEVSAAIDLGPRILSAQALTPILATYQTCGDLNVLDAPPTGYPNGAQVSVVGRVDSTATRDALANRLIDTIGDRTLRLDIQVLNPTLCLIDGVLPNVPEAGVRLDFREGSNPTANHAGTFLVGENPIIEVVIPPEMTEGYLYVSALDVSGNVFHLLPNLLFADNDLETLRDGRDGDIRIRVAHSIADGRDGGKLAFVVDDTSLGKTKIIAIHSDQQIFEGLRPTTESAGGYANALAQRLGAINSLDSRILTTVNR
ncbi:serine/threonine-protein kinase [uncultured Tateyamaria sp.]|uniref:serine/threonine-protein kinase n=1 Tax=uncultured Tateyamaria sp. TaxID=455651 RepID=UPI00262E2F5D|nr:serine/threonine-protein kinase [uncultured Tateyamaria sp.]